MGFLGSLITNLKLKFKKKSGVSNNMADLYGKNVLFILKIICNYFKISVKILFSIIKNKVTATALK